jgi:enoyl-CoA hydratase/carnithine racemase
MDDQGAPEATVEMTLDAGLAEIVLNRPDKLNAMNDAMASDLTGHLEAAKDHGVRALMIRGAGKGFCAGRDLADARPGEEDAHAILAEVFNPLMARVSDFPAPTFAAVHGACLGTGLGLALACDVVYVSDDARLGSPFARIGAVLDSGAHSHFVARLGSHRALELIYTGRLLSGRDAQAWGLVNRSVAGTHLVDIVRRMARSIADGPTLAFLESKRLVREILEVGIGLTEVLDREAVAQGEVASSHDYIEGITAFQQKRKPAFIGH